MLERLVITLKQQALVSQLADDYLASQEQASMIKNKNNELKFTFDITEMSLSGMIPLSELQEMKESFKWTQQDTDEDNGKTPGSSLELITDIDDFIWK